MIKSIALFLISASIFQAKCDLYTCSRFSNCLCRGADNVSVFCQVFNNLNILPELFQDLHGHSIIVLNLKDCTVDYLQNNLFINASINALNFNCPFHKLEEDSLSSINALEFLLMNMTKFAKIPPAVTKLGNLKYLKLMNGKLIAVNRELQNMTKLQRLNLKNNMIQEIASDAFIFHKNLELLDISNNRIKFLHPNMFQHCTNLRGFRVRSNYLESTDGIPRGDKIVNLHLRGNAFHTIKFARYVNVEGLNIGQNPLRLLPNIRFSYNFPRLKKLFINDCGLSILPSMLLEMLNHLEYIHLGFNGILRIPPKFFRNLRRLRTVKLQSNKLEHLEDNMFEDCRNITYVTLNHNRLKSLGNAFKDTGKLNKLFLSSNDFEILKDDEFKYFTSLEYLDMGQNKITCLEKNVFLMMKKIKELRLNGNRISSLNHSLNNLRSLETLFLNSNQLNVITENDLLGLIQLKVLYLEKNKLTSVNGAFRMLNNLRYLDLRRNKLHTLAKNSFPENASLLEVAVLSNKWECDCRLLWLRELFIERNSRGKSPYCRKPKNFQTRELVSLSISDLVQWPEECPPFCNCSCVNKEDGNFFVKVDCSRTNMSEFPSVLPERTGELNLNDNLLTRLNFSKKTLSNLKTLDAERNHLNSLNFEAPQSITTMKLAGNKLTRFFDKPPTNIFLWTLAENPWICDCKTINFRIWMLQQTNKILDVKNIRCGNHTSRKFLQNKAIIDLLDSDLCPSVVSTIIIASVSILVLLLLGTSSGLFYYRYHYHIKVWLYSRGLKWLKREDEEDHGKIYDAFISAADEDILWVKDVLLPELEEKHPYYTVYEPRKHMMGGEMCPYEKELEVASKSRRVIVLISKNYVENNFLMGIFKACFVNSLEEKKYRFILIIIGDLPPLSDMDQSLRAAIESTKYLRFGQKLFWEMLRFAMPKKTRKIDECVTEETSEDVPLLQ